MQRLLVSSATQLSLFIGVTAVANPSLPWLEVAADQIVVANTGTNPYLGGVFLDNFFWIYPWEGEEGMARYILRSVGSQFKAVISLAVNSGESLRYPQRMLPTQPRETSEVAIGWTKSML